eukprot:5267520-Pyramimonas_sp.AAC.1
MHGAACDRVAKFLQRCPLLLPDRQAHAAPDRRQSGRRVGADTSRTCPVQGVICGPRRQQLGLESVLR